LCFSNTITPLALLGQTNLAALYESPHWSERIMDMKKCRALKAQFMDEAEPQAIPIQQFFDGNDDEGSIGCNLSPHPGMGLFSEVLVGLLERKDVEAVYVQISELDPNDESWPFSDLVVIAGSISIKDLRKLLAPLCPGDVSNATDYHIAEEIAAKHSEMLIAWWD